MNGRGARGICQRSAESGQGMGEGGGGETPLYRLESLSGNSSLLHAIFGTQINSYRMTLLARKLYFTSCFSSEVTELIVLSML